MSAGEIAPFAERLLAWWDRHGRKDLPWQNPRTPYRVWISEIMLQQTQVSTVIPYFERWMRSFPDLETLASAPLDDVLGHWSGLGYYARARNLHKAARICMEGHGSRLPGSSGELSALPGIGRSTANAIVSLSTGEPAAVLDGNVRRTLARHTATEGWTGKAAVQNRLWQAAEKRLPDTRGDDYTQAIMDLGALICRRKRPDCGRCPVRDDCRALATDRVGELPTPRPPTRVGEKTLHMVILRDARGRVLLEKRPPAGIWGGLWCLPEAKTPGAAALRLGQTVDSWCELPALEHRLSHLRMTIRPALAEAGQGTAVECPGNREWFSRAQRSELGLPRPVSELLAKLDDGELA
jgi:A/G-specific adenine glycosylase